MSKISMIAAVAENWVIGGNQDLVWDLPDDMKFFKKTTKGHPVVMGRKNYHTIPERFRPLPHRQNIVITRNKNYEATGTDIVHSVEAAIKLAKNYDDDIYIIGGGQIYELALPMADELLITWVHARPVGDTYFPRFDESSWQKVSDEFHPKDEMHEHSFTFTKYNRIV